jgi:hypothetical protein
MVEMVSNMGDKALVNHISGAKIISDSDGATNREFYNKETQKVAKLMVFGEVATKEDGMALGPMGTTKDVCIHFRLYPSNLNIHHLS